MLSTIGLNVSKFQKFPTQMMDRSDRSPEWGRFGEHPHLITVGSGRLALGHLVLNCPASKLCPVVQPCFAKHVANVALDCSLAHI